MPEPRIGVFICHCGRNIGGYIDVPQVVEYAKGLPNVVHVEDNLYTCSEDGTSAIKKGIRDFDLNRVVVAACTPATHEPLFRSACEAMGLNKYLFEFVNIREQCSWVHGHLPEAATEKAETLIRMGVAKARLLEPLEEIEIKVTPSTLVIGGGIAGMSAALNLANQGFTVHLIEKEPQLGGMLLRLDKLFTTNRQARDLVAPIVDQAMNDHYIAVHLKTRVKEVAGFVGNFNVTLDENGEKRQLHVGTIIVATGGDELKPAGLYGYGKIEGVLTQLELEQRMKNGSVSGQNTVIINCVGARVPERTYCSRFCCLTAIKNARLLKEASPSSKVWLLHRDLMTYGVEFEDYYRQTMATGVRFIRYCQERPPEVIGNEKVTRVRVYHELRQRELELPADMVVLTTPLIPNSSNEELSQMLKVPLGKEGFFLEAHPKLQPVEFATDGIYVCGSARWPVEVTEALSQGYAAAAKAAILMRRGYLKPEAISGSVNKEICSGCAACAAVCPYRAIEITVNNGRQVADVAIALCRGCGTCAATCPSGAISMNQYQDEQIAAQIEALAY